MKTEDCELFRFLHTGPQPIQNLVPGIVVRTNAWDIPKPDCLCDNQWFAEVFCRLTGDRDDYGDEVYETLSGKRFVYHVYDTTFRGHDYECAVLRPPVIEDPNKTS